MHLASLEDVEVLYIDKVTGGPRIALSGVGRRLPLHCTAVGRCCWRTSRRARSV